MRLGALLGSLAVVLAVTSVNLTGASTPGQVDKGLQVYQANCRDCHGPNLEGEQGPPLRRDGLLAKYGGDFDALRSTIVRTMPWGMPGTLTPEEYTDVTHFIFNQNGVGPDGFGHPAFGGLWTVADQPVAAQQVKRSWLWGPEGYRVAWEPYAEAPGGQRLVQYFDKTRMEITRIGVNRDQPGYVTNGLLATELVTGRLQLGDATFEQRQPANVNVAGDPDDAQGPTYATFSRLTGRVDRSQAAVIATVDRAGKVGQNGALGNYTDYVEYIPETGHNIPRVFWDFLNSSGLVNQNDQLVTGRIFDPWYAPSGFPVTEAYWTRAKVAGEVKDVLVQVFQRRVLTYTPSNPEGFQVEMGNVGRHYTAWRYGG